MSRTRCSVSPERFIAPAGRVSGGVSLSLSLSLGQLMGEDVLPPDMDVQYGACVQTPEEMGTNTTIHEDC